MEGRYEKRMSLSTFLTKAVTVVSTVSRELNDNNALRELVCGSYSDGKTRSIVDAAKGEYKSPKQKSKEEKGGKKKHKKHKKNKYKKKYKKLKNKTKKHNKKQKAYAKKYKYTI